MTDDTFIDDALAGYVECMMWVGFDWSSEEETGNPTPLDEAGFGIDDITPDATDAMLADVRAFVLSNAADIESAGIEAGQVGHDFCLTRNGHGTGFWDRGLGATGERLSVAARAYGESNLYVGDDGKLYVD